MMRCETITNIDEDVFNNLYNHSIDAMDSGTFPWDRHNLTAPEEKRRYLLSLYNRILEMDDGLVWLFSDGDTPLLLCAGTKRGDDVRWQLGLVGPDSDGSKAYLYGTEFGEATDAYWDSIGIAGWTLVLAEDNDTVHTAFKKRETAFNEMVDDTEISHNSYVRKVR